VEVVKKSLSSKWMLDKLNNTFLSLIPNVEDAFSIDSFHSISLCNAIYKVISKVVANQLKKILPSIISKE